MPEQIRIRPLHDPQRVALFVNNVWQDQYPQDKNLCIWPQAFFEWQFLSAPTGYPAICLAAFIGDELVGLHCGEVWPLRHANGDEHHVTFLSCVSARKTHQRLRVSEALLAAMRGWSEDHNSRQFFGYVNPDKSAMVGRRYWSTRRDLHFNFLAGGRQWQILPEDITAQKAAADFKDCHALPDAAQYLRNELSRPSNTQPLAVKWSESRISHQLHFGGIADYLQVCDGPDQGICSYVILPVQGGWNVCNIDFLSATGGRIDLAAAVLARALALASSRNCRRVLTVGSPVNNDALLFRLGFVPCIPSFTPMMATWGRDAVFSPTTSLKLFYK